MKRKFLLQLFILALIFSCKPDATENNLNVAQKTVKDSTIIGADKDQNGCLASAGYIYSKVNKDCVRMFSGIPLYANQTIEKNEDPNNATYILFSEDGNLAEIFLAGEDNSVVLNKVENSKAWSFKNYKLIAKNGYVLEKDSKIIFSGDGELGSKITGGDDDHENIETE